jgi:hypothetical protein
MAEGSNVGPQGCLPLHGNSEIIGQSTTLDVLTLTQAASGTGDYLVCQNSAGTELFSLSSAGAPSFASWPVIMGGGVAFASNATSASATATGITSDFAVAIAGNANALIGSYNAVASSGKVTIYASASIGTATTFNFVAFQTRA